MRSKILPDLDTQYVTYHGKRAKAHFSFALDQNNVQTETKNEMETKNKKEGDAGKRTGRYKDEI